MEVYYKNEALLMSIDRKITPLGKWCEANNHSAYYFTVGGKYGIILEVLKHFRMDKLTITNTPNSDNAEMDIAKDIIIKTPNNETRLLDIVLMLKSIDIDTPLDKKVKTDTIKIEINGIKLFVYSFTIHNGRLHYSIGLDIIED